MSNIKWIKLSTAMFEDEKIRLIEQMPDADTILVIWVKLLAQAGKTNASGYIYLSQNIPYTEEMLATIFNRPVNTVRLALKVFQEFGMIDIDDDQYISISNWEKHQNVDALEKIREQTRKRVAKHREKQKAKKLQETLPVTQEREKKPRNDKESNDCNVTVTKNNATEEERREKKEELDIDKEQLQEHSVSKIIQFWDNNGFGYNNINAKQSLLSWLDNSIFKDPAEMILKAMEIASANNKRTLAYVEGILRNWKNESILTPGDIQERPKRTNNSQFTYDPSVDSF